MRNNDRPDDDEEGDISDDPFLSAVNTDLESVNKRNDNKLLGILLSLVPLAFLYEHSGISSIWLNAVFIGLVVGSIVYTIFRVVRQKQKVAAKYGLVCHVCGYKPKAHMVLSAAMTQRCAKCGANLNG
ncbi:MAG: hypothetical protein B7Y41_02300 [Hydrogenophilales bacterium 28-61-23]|nr:MAG: hypothetical protein B7Y41_02300 [Hydrogenophilales bacterium 28-61-23]